MTNATKILRIIQEARPDEIYNLAAMSHVHVSSDTLEYAGNAGGLGTSRILEAPRVLDLDKARPYQASSSEPFGLVQETPKKMKKRPFRRATLMEWPSFTLIGLRSIIG
jgi:GDPmannose 4,6-dehydratase